MPPQARRKPPRKALEHAVFDGIIRPVFHRPPRSNVRRFRFWGLPTFAQRPACLFQPSPNTMNATLPITKRGAEKLKAELHRLKTKDRPDVINAIAEARA